MKFIRTIRQWREQLGGGAAAERQRRLDYRQTFASPHGQRVLADILARAGVLTTSHRPGDPHETAYQEGRRRTALEIIQTLNQDPSAQFLMARDGDTDPLFTPDEEAIDA